jgi:hypothetical protein
MFGAIRVWGPVVLVLGLIGGTAWLTREYIETRRELAMWRTNAEAQSKVIATTAASLERMRRSKGDLIDALDQLEEVVDENDCSSPSVERALDILRERRANAAGPG